MCLIIQKPKGVKFSRYWLRDFWTRNRDGAGIMWHTGEAVDVQKITSPSVKEWFEFYDEYAARRDCLIHLRWRTHGAIREDNTHPYLVGRGYYLMHNGVLAIGNESDPSRSDTWHFIERRLKPLLKRSPWAFNNPKFIKELGKEIGSNNRFAILGNDGKQIIVNRQSGTHFKGAWLSNRYAWSAPKQYAVESKSSPKMRTTRDFLPPVARIERDYATLPSITERGNVRSITIPMWAYAENETD